MGRVLAVKHKQRVSTRGSLEQTFGKLLLVTEVQCTFNVSTIVFVLKAAVNNHLVVIQVIVCTIQYFHQCLVSDARKALGFASSKVRKLEWVGVIDIHDRLKAAGLVVFLFLFGIHHITGMLKHA